jgi:L-aspartate oxidase
VVSRAIVAEAARTNTDCVFLDLTNLNPDFVKARFPTISERCSSYGIDIWRDLIPVQVSVHFMMGGMRTNLRAETSVRGLYACGEVACTGVHGANRLASNSLLESLVFGVRAALTAAGDMDTKLPATVTRMKYRRKSIIPAHEVTSQPVRGNGTPGHAVPAEIRRSIRNVMWEKVGIIRRAEMLEEAHVSLRKYSSLQPTIRSEFELQNMLILSRLIADSALLRQESRGAHYRSDYPNRDDTQWRRHLTFQRTENTQL